MGELAGPMIQRLSFLFLQQEMGTVFSLLQTAKLRTIFFLLDLFSVLACREEENTEQGGARFGLPSSGGYQLGEMWQPREWGSLFYPPRFGIDMLGIKFPRVEVM